LFLFYTTLGYEDSKGKDNPHFNPSLPLTFSFDRQNLSKGGRSTNGKQTSKGLFIFWSGKIPGKMFVSALLLFSTLRKNWEMKIKRTNADQ